MTAWLHAGLACLIASPPAFAQQTQPPTVSSASPSVYRYSYDDGTIISIERGADAQVTLLGPAVAKVCLEKPGRPQSCLFTARAFPPYSPPILESRLAPDGAATVSFQYWTTGGGCILVVVGPIGELTEANVGCGFFTN